MATVESVLEFYRKEGSCHPCLVALMMAERFLQVVSSEEVVEVMPTLPRNLLWFVREVAAEGPPRFWTNCGDVVAPDTEGVRAVRDWITQYGAAWDAAEHARDLLALAGVWKAGPSSGRPRPPFGAPLHRIPLARLTLRADGGGRWTTPAEEVEIVYRIDVTPCRKTLEVVQASGLRSGESAHLTYALWRGKLLLESERIEDEEGRRSYDGEEFRAVYERVDDLSSA